MQVTLCNITKRYGRVQANAGISLDLRPGRIYGLLGENGAGKSTLMRVLAGHTVPDEGEISFDDQPVGRLTPSRALSLGVGMLYQDPLDFPALKVWENFQIGAPPRSRRAAMARLKEWGDRLHFDLPPGERVGDITVGERQQLEIIRLMDAGARLLILDEPTTGITLNQKEKLFQTVRELAARPDHLIIVVTHKLEEALALCDEIMIMRQGRLEGLFSPPYEAERIVQAMFGSDSVPKEGSPRERAGGGPACLRLEMARFTGDQYGLAGIDLEVGPGEIIGLAGLEGNGQEILLRGLAGLARMTGGRLIFHDRDLSGRPFQMFRRSGIHFLPAARLEQGLFPDLSLAQHVCLAFPDQKKRLSDFFQEECVQRYRLMAEPATNARQLSGGNQQRLLLSLIPKNTRLLLMEHPTRGLDMGSAAQVWGHLRQRCLDGDLPALFFGRPG